MLPARSQPFCHIHQDVLQDVYGHVQLGREPGARLRHFGKSGPAFLPVCRPDTPPPATTLDERQRNHHPLRAGAAVDASIDRSLYDCQMGWASERQIEEGEQGWSFSSDLVCKDCVADYALARAIQESEDPSHICTFCGRGPAAEMDVLLKCFVEGLRTEFGNADDEGVFYEGREGGYQWHETWDTWDLVEGYADVLVGEGLFEAVVDRVEDCTWVRVNFIAPRKDEALQSGWEAFCEAVQYETRYVFWLRNNEDEREPSFAEGVPAHRVLDDVGELVGRLGLIREVPAGKQFWRARTHADPGVVWQALDLGTCSRYEAKQANRMSPAGIPMFYGSEQSGTALAEVALRSADSWATVACFETSRPCRVIDFTDLPAVPSMFDSHALGDRRDFMFLRSFAAQLSLPARDTLEQIDYVPTQVLTEYLLKILDRPSCPVGLLYRSAIDNQVSVVMNVPREHCRQQGPGWTQLNGLHLGLQPDSQTTVRIRGLGDL
jgi:hypothetical protein